MQTDSIKKRVKKLRDLINKYRYQYHVENRLEISEDALDSLKYELKKLEDGNPELITPDSPTQRVEGKPISKFRKAVHSSPMLSLEDAFSEGDMRAWEERVSKLLPSGEKEYFAEVKLDGLAISLIYDGGVLARAATRGDGKVGEDITSNVKTLESVPLALGLWGANPTALSKRLVNAGTIEVRGEAIIPKSALERVNREQEKKGEKKYANSRNLAAGSLRQLDPKIAGSRGIEFYAYDLLVDGGPARHSEKHVVLRELGFKTGGLARICGSLDDVFKFHSYVEKKRGGLAYEIDGIVVSLNDVKKYGALGVAGKAPRGAIAYKFAPKEAMTRVSNITVQVGRTGILTPVAHLEPVNINGVTISRATLHNEDEIKRLGVLIGDSVIVGRAGDVIPDVKRVLRELRTGGERAFKMPSACPACGKGTLKDEGGVIRRCANRDCPSLKREGLYYFVSKHAFDIDGLGPRTIDVLLDNGLIQDAADLFALKEGDLALLERYGEKSAANIVLSIERSKKISLPRFLVALGILHVGEETALDIARRFGSLENIINASAEDVLKIKNIGSVVARSVNDFFGNARNLKFIEKLIRAGVKVADEKKIKPGKLAGKKFVFTGEMESQSRDSAKNFVRGLSGEVSETVSKNTDFVVVGRNPGSKYAKAKKLGINTISEKEFLKLIGK